MKTQKWLPALAVITLIIGFPLTLCGEGVELKSGGPMAFGKKGVLFVADPVNAQVHAIETGDTEKANKSATLKVEGIDSKIASMLGTETRAIRINDLAVNPANGNAYVSVTRGSGDSSKSLILKVNADNGKISEVDLGELKSTSVKIPNPASGKDRRGRDQRRESITDIMLINGELYVAGLSNEEFASNLRAIPYPFKDSSEGSSIEIYHGAHGQFETRSPIRTFAAYDVGGETNLLAAYTCTPLVRIPVNSLKPKSKVKGTTIAELGNRNRPLDMIVYKKDGSDYILMANSARGIMKIKLAEIEKQVAITERVTRGGTEGLAYDTIKDWTGVMQLDKVNDEKVMLLIRNKDGSHDLKVVSMP